MAQLGCNYSEPLLELLARGEAEVDWIKLSREDTLLEEIALCRTVRPMLVHTLGHAGMPPEDLNAVDWDGFNQALRAAGSPHIAIHLLSMPADWSAAPSDDEIRERMHRQILTAKAKLQVPLLLENVPLGGSKGIYPLCVQPGFIREMLDATGTDLMLDTAHLRCAAYHLGVDERAYATALPLERVREIHVCGPRLEPGAGMRDRHRELEEEDYALLAWLLERTAPAMVTLEYGGTGPVFEQPGMNDPAALRRQLVRLKGMLT